MIIRHSLNHQKAPFVYPQKRKTNRKERPSHIYIKSGKVIDINKIWYKKDKNEVQRHVGRNGVHMKEMLCRLTDANRRSLRGSEGNERWRLASFAHFGDGLLDIGKEI